MVIPQVVIPQRRSEAKARPEPITPVRGYGLRAAELRKAARNDKAYDGNFEIDVLPTTTDWRGSTRVVPSADGPPGRAATVILAT